jgi:hypothetical protein
MRMIITLLGIFNPDITFHYTNNLIWWYVRPSLLTPAPPLTIRPYRSVERRIVEMNFGIICACLPCLKPLVKHYFPNLAVFDPRVEQRVISSFHLSNRAAHFGQPSTDDGYDASGATTLPAVGNSNVLRTKPSAGSGSSDEGHGIRDEKATAQQTDSNTLVPSSNTRSVDSQV